MSIKTSVYIATSLDGFIARKNGSLDWLDSANATVTKGEDCGYSTFMESVDVLVMGRNTYEKVLSFGEWPYANKHVVVLSRSKISFPVRLGNKIENLSGTPKELCTILSNKGYKHLYIDGGITIQRFLAEGLIDEITVTIIPVILGAGIPLFGNLEKDINLKLIDNRSYEFGFTQSKYKVIKNS